MDVNGSLRGSAPKGAEWVGLDFLAGPGVDIVVEPEQDLPFGNESFDLVIASSVFEHDPQFWVTFSEMIRVLKHDGFCYINAPSNGYVHRFPLDVFRFYPDASIALLRWGRKNFSDLSLVESFIAEQDGALWNDFVAVYQKMGGLTHNNLISVDTAHSNLYLNGDFQSQSFRELPQDLLIQQYKRAEYNKVYNTSGQRIIDGIKRVVVRLFGR
jgi:SAM-dependent methyltransferase